MQAVSGWQTKTDDQVLTALRNQQVVKKRDLTTKELRAYGAAKGITVKLKTLGGLYGEPPPNTATAELIGLARQYVELINSTEIIGGSDPNDPDWIEFLGALDKLMPTRIVTITDKNYLVGLTSVTQDVLEANGLEEATVDHIKRARSL